MSICFFVQTGPGINPFGVTGLFGGATGPHILRVPLFIIVTAGYVLCKGKKQKVEAGGLFLYNEEKHDRIYMVMIRNGMREEP